MSADADKIEHIQQKFAAFCFNRLLSQFSYIQAFFFFCGSLQVPVRYVRDFSVFIVTSYSKIPPSARCSSTANVVWKDVYTFGTKHLSLNLI
jgi:hypothetical protein